MQNTDIYLAIGKRSYLYIQNNTILESECEKSHVLVLSTYNPSNSPIVISTFGEFLYFKKYFHVWLLNDTGKKGYFYQMLICVKRQNFISKVSLRKSIILISKSHSINTKILNSSLELYKLLAMVRKSDPY